MTTAAQQGSDLASTCPEWCDHAIDDHWMFGDGHMECSEGEFLAGSCRRGSGCPDCRVSGSLLIGSGRAIARQDMHARLPQGTPSGSIVPAIIRIGDPYIYVHLYGCAVDEDAALTIQQARNLAARLVELADSLEGPAVKSTGYSYDDLCAAAVTGYSRGFSDKKRGPHPSGGSVVVLSEWVLSRSGWPDPADPTTLVPAEA